MGADTKAHNPASKVRGFRSSLVQGRHLRGRFESKRPPLVSARTGPKNRGPRILSSCKGRTMKRELSREELFALVWERPTSEIATELGISDVALAKLCKRQQVPKPPRGYWARVQAGQTPRQPPLPGHSSRLDPFSENGRWFMCLPMAQPAGSDTPAVRRDSSGATSSGPGLVAGAPRAAAQRSSRRANEGLRDRAVRDGHVALRRRLHNPCALRCWGWKGLLPQLTCQAYRERWSAWQGDRGQVSVDGRFQEAGCK
jgi:hypothetical protein